MGAIIRMNSKTWAKDFINEQDPDQFQFVLISQNITTSEKFGNVKAIPRLIPPPQIASLKINQDDRAYKTAFLNFIQHPTIEPFISIIVQGAVVNNLNLVLLCSKTESDFEYIDMICEYIEEVYQIPTYSYKKFKKNPEKAAVFKDVDSVKRILAKKMEAIKLAEADLETNVDKEKVLKQLKKMKPKELRKYAKMRNIKVDKEMTPKELIKKITKKLA